MQTLNTEYFIINYDDDLQDFVENSLKIVKEQLPQIQAIFGDNLNNVRKIKASFFTKRENFIAYINKITNGNYSVPDWATGCFYNEEIQTLIDKNNENDMKYKIHTLTHEWVHLIIQELIYKKYNLNRLRWFDESFAVYLDGTIKNRTIKYFQRVYTSLNNICENFNMKTLNNINKVQTNEYNGYDMFMIIGKYIFENNLADKYIKILIKNDSTELNELNVSILQKAVMYLKENLIETQ